MISMDEVYNVTKFLRGELYVDREYPYDFNEKTITNIQPQSKAQIIQEEAGIHENIIQFTDLKSDESIVLQREPRKYDHANVFEVKIKSNKELDPNIISVDFSEGYEGTPSVMHLEAKETTIPPDTVVLLSFSITQQNDVNGKVKKLSNIRSIKINFKQDIDKLFLIDTVFKNHSYTFTIEDVAKQLLEAESYVKTRLKKDNVPEELHYIYPKAAAAFINRVRWQNEGNFQDTNSYSHFKRYSQQLLAEVDDTIEAYKDKEEGDENDINMNLVGYTDIGL